MNKTIPIPGLSDGEQAIRSVLIVDDSRLQRRILASLLARWGMQVHEAESGEAALSVLDETAVDLILSDWMMPGMSGVELCRRIRESDLERYVYFILLTSKSEQKAVTEGLINGADNYLVKPVNSDELRARIMAADRIIRVERELKETNHLVQNTLDELQTLYDSIDRDLVAARKLQQSLVPRRAIALPGATVSFLFQPCGHVSGDLVGHVPVSPERFGLFSLDVSGHGVAAAMITARLAAILGSAATDQNVALTVSGGRTTLRDPAEICARLNRRFLQEVQTEHYFTMVFADIDLTAGRVRFVQAGHPNPLVQSSDGRCAFVGTGGLPVGLVEEAEWEVTEITLNPGDRLFLYSDGVTECPLTDGTMLEEAGLQEIVSDAFPLSGERLLDLLNWRLHEILEGAGLPDDVSGVLLEVDRTTAAR